MTKITENIGEARVTERQRRAVNLGDFILPIFIAVYWAIVGIIEPRFLTFDNVDNLMSQIAPLLVMSIGQAFTIITGGFDLSMASTMSLSGMAGVLSVKYVGVWGGVAVMALVGTFVGFVNGALIAYQRTSPFIVTLGMSSVATAFALILGHGVPIYTVPPELSGTIGFGHFAGLPVSFEIAMALLLIGAFLLRKTVFGRYVYAIGSNSSAAIRSGVPVPFYTLLVYAFAGFTSGVAGIILTAWVNAAQPVAEPDMTLKSIAAVVLGGIALTGGSGGMTHVFLGCIILGSLANSMTMIGVSSYYQILAIGIVIIIAVMLDRVRRPRL